MTHILIVWATPVMLEARRIAETRIIIGLLCVTTIFFARCAEAEFATSAFWNATPVIRAAWRVGIHVKIIIGCRNIYTTSISVNLFATSTRFFVRS